MAYIGDSDGSYEHIANGKIDFLEDVLQNAMIESNEDDNTPTNDEFWKPVKDGHLAENRNDLLSDKRVHDSDYSSDVKRKNMYMGYELDHSDMYGKETRDSLENDIGLHAIYRSQSDDHISSKTGKNKTDGLINNTESKSEMGSKEFIKCNSKYINPQSPPVSLVSDEEVSAEGPSERDSQGAGIDFFCEYERKIDMLEYCDYALEQAFMKLSEYISQLHVENVDAYPESMANRDTSEVGDKSKDKLETTDDAATDAQNEEEKDQNLQDQPSDEEEIGKTHNNELNRGIRGAMNELEMRFEEFVTEVGEIIQLGALAAKHAMRVERWAAQLQTLYTSIKSDHENIQAYVEERERQSFHDRQQLQTELSKQAEHVRLLMEELFKKEGHAKEKQNLYKRIGERYIKNPVNPNKPRSGEALVDILLNNRYSEEQSIALDFARQSKISELKLVVLQQQTYIQKLELQNKEMDGMLQGVLFRHERDEPEEPPQEYQLRHLRPLTEALSQVSDVLYCDHTQYLPGKSTDPQKVAEQVFEIGEGNITTPGDTETIFVPQQLGYIMEEIRKESSNKTADVPELGSGECNAVPVIERTTVIDDCVSPAREVPTFLDKREESLGVPLENNKNINSLERYTEPAGEKDSIQDCVTETVHGDSCDDQLNNNPESLQNILSKKVAESEHRSQLEENNYLGKMYPVELEINETTESNTSGSYLDLLLSMGKDGQLHTSLYDKRDDFNFHITNIPFLSSNIPSSSAYGVFISQLIRYARACSSYECFILRPKRLANKLLTQGYVVFWITATDSDSVSPIMLFTELDLITKLDLFTEFDTFIELERFPWNICDGCGMPAEDADSFRTPGLIPFGIRNCSSC